MEQFILIIHVLAAIGLIVLILLQQGKGAEAGASFGSGASQTIFGSQGSGNFLTRTTAILVTVFFITSLALGYLASNRGKPKDLDELLKKVQPQSQPQSQSSPQTTSESSKGSLKEQKEGKEGTENLEQGENPAQSEIPQ